MPRFFVNARIANAFFLYLVPPLIVSLILSGVFLIKGIYPFGPLTIIHGDMGQGFIPICYHLYDVFYHGKSLFWDPFLGTGSNIFGSEALSGMFSPVSWLILISSREQIPYFMSFLLAIRMCLMAVSSIVFINAALRETPLFWKIAISVMYAFCGYVLVYHTNMMWLDSAILFPLLLLTLKRLVDDGKLFGFIAVLSANLIFNYYISFMVLVFVFFGSGVWLFFCVDANKRKKALFNLGVCVLTALLVTGFVTIPACLQSMSSLRFARVSILSLFSEGNGLYKIGNKALLLSFSSLALVGFLLLWKTFKTDRKGVAAFLLLIAMTTLQVIVEPTNLIWHTGSYALFPLRFGFIPAYLLLAGTAFYFAKHRDRSAFKGAMTYAFWGGIALAACGYAVFTGMRFGHAVIRYDPAFGIGMGLIKLFFRTVLFFGIALGILLKFKECKLKYILIGAVLFTELFLHSLWYIGNASQEMHSGKWLFLANRLEKNSIVNPDSLSRYKDVDSTLNSNYPLIMGVPSMSGWTHLIEPEQQQAFVAMGYSAVYTRLLDTGGTLFSDRVLRVDHYLTKSVFKNDLFDNAGFGEGYTVYKAKAALPFGIPFSSTSAPVSFAKDASPFDNQNLMFQTLFDRQDSIIELARAFPRRINVETVQDGKALLCTRVDKSKAGILKYKIVVSGAQYLYLNASVLHSQSKALQVRQKSFDRTKARAIKRPARKPVPGAIPAPPVNKHTRHFTTIRINVNRRTLPVPTLGFSDNLLYPAAFNNGLLNLGVFHDETVKLELVFPHDIVFGSIAIGKLSVDKMKQLPDSLLSVTHKPVIRGNRICLKIDSTRAGNSLFLPVTFDSGWSCKINGKPSPVRKIFGAFIALPLSAGNNVIELRYVPRGFALGLLLSSVTLLFWAAFCFLPNRFARVENQALLNLVYFIFWTVYGCAVIGVYVIPILFSIVKIMPGSIFT